MDISFNTDSRHLGNFPIRIINIGLDVEILCSNGGSNCEKNRNNLYAHH